jgi:hypothetical protein
MKKIITIIMFSSLLIFGMCKHETTTIINGGNGVTDTTKIIDNPKNDSVCFNTQILPLITASCAQVGCHDANSRVEGLILNSYSGIMNMGTKDLLKYIKLTSGKMMPPPPQPRMEQANIDIIQRWVNEGAKNRICNPTSCDTLNVKYTSHIAPIMNTYCKGCHNSSNVGGGVNLDNYADVKTSTLTGKMICTITANGCAIMPKGGPTLSNCNIRKIKIWAAANCPQ